MGALSALLLRLSLVSLLTRASTLLFRVTQAGACGNGDSCFPRCPQPQTTVLRSPILPRDGRGWGQLITRMAPPGQLTRSPSRCTSTPKWQLGHPHRCALSSLACRCEGRGSPKCCVSSAEGDTPATASGFYVPAVQGRFRTPLGQAKAGFGAGAGPWGSSGAGGLCEGSAGLPQVGHGRFRPVLAAPLSSSGAEAGKCCWGKGRLWGQKQLATGLMSLCFSPPKCILTVKK